MKKAFAVFALTGALLAVAPAAQAKSEKAPVSGQAAVGVTYDATSKLFTVTGTASVVNEQVEGLTVGIPAEASFEVGGVLVADHVPFQKSLTLTQTYDGGVNATKFAEGTLTVFGQHDVVLATATDSKRVWPGYGGPSSCWIEVSGKTQGDEWTYTGPVQVHFAVQGMSDDDEHVIYLYPPSGVQRVYGDVTFELPTGSTSADYTVANIVNNGLGHEECYSEASFFLVP